MKQASAFNGKWAERLPGPVPPPLRVAEMAYQILLSRGYQEGHQADLWSEAEARLRSVSSEKGGIVTAHRQKSPLRFGNWIARIYDAHGERKAPRVIQFAASWNLVTFREQQSFDNSLASR
jgi:hypothetical protein